MRCAAPFRAANIPRRGHHQVSVHGAVTPPEEVVMSQRLGPKLLNFATDIAGETVEQAKITASMPFVYPHVSLMPDAHLGKGSAVGTVIPTKGAVIPAAVG